MFLGISASDSGLGSPSDHSISLFDYLTLEHPPFDKPMDDLHLDYLYDRLSTYSVDMMLHKVDRVNKLGDDVLSIESKLLEVEFLQLLTLKHYLMTLFLCIMQWLTPLICECRAHTKIAFVSLTITVLPAWNIPAV